MEADVVTSMRLAVDDPVVQVRTTVEILDDLLTRERDTRFDRRVATNLKLSGIAPVEGPGAGATSRVIVRHDASGPRSVDCLSANRRVPGTWKQPEMTAVSDFALSKEDLVVINPGPGEFVHVMEGQRHGYRNLIDLSDECLGVRRARQLSLLDTESKATR